MLASELDYELPEELIATHPLPEREGSRLLVVDRALGALEHQQMRALPALLPPALFVFNDTRVIPARLRGVKPSGGKFELLLVDKLEASAHEQRWLARGRPLKTLRAGLVLSVGELTVTIMRRVDELTLEVLLSAEGDLDSALERTGEVPLPPYIARAPEATDRERYQTVFAREPGAVAAPTAGLHFGEALLSELAARGHERAFVTLHVGPGTFAPLLVEDLREHSMHEERYFVPEATVEAIARAKREGRPVVAVGTTVVRTLEASAQATGMVTAGAGATKLCIYPPYSFRVVDALVTNFHLPRSTLLALVMAFAGTELTRSAYRAAIAERYRFFSYGDALLVR